MKVLLICAAMLYVVSNHFVFITAQSWSYDDQDEWPGDCNVGENQSPIDIPEDTELIQKNSIPSLKFLNWDKHVETIVKNDGHTVLITIPGNIKPSLSGGGLSGTFHFENLHFHWPAEHTVDERSFDLEAHFVFYSSKFSNFTEASKDKNGVAVIGTFCDVVHKDETRDSTIFKKLAAAAKEVSNEVNSQTSTDPISIGDLLPNNPVPFYSYFGSLTTPDCNEVVRWFILKYVGKINYQEYKSLTTIYGSNHELLDFTNREIQPLNERPVYCKLY